MRRSIAFKSLLRDPVKMMLTFLLIAAASFALFFRVTDYAVTTRESARAQSFYYGVAALDCSVPEILAYDMEMYISPEDKPWPTDEQLEEFSSLPGVTLADTRYTTDGLVEDYKRVLDQECTFLTNDFIVEGTYTGYEEYDADTRWPRLYLLLDDVKIHAGDLDLSLGKNRENNDVKTMKIEVQFEDGKAFNIADEVRQKREYYDTLEKGSRYLICGFYYERSGTAFTLGGGDDGEHTYDIIRKLDGLGPDYLETEEFSWYKGTIAAINQGIMSYDVEYVSDMRAIPYVNERKLVISQGRPLTVKDTEGCVVSETFIETYGLSLGDTIHIKLGDRVKRHGSAMGTRPRDAETMSDFKTSAELEIVGVYRFNNPVEERMNEWPWRYGPGTIFVNKSLLPVAVPDNYEISMADYSVFVEDPDDIEEFRDAAEKKASEMGLALRFSDGGWSNMKDSIETGTLTSLLTTILYVLGAALALFLAVYLYIGRNGQVYAIMRTLGVPGKKAGRSIVLPLMTLSVFAISAGGIAGLFYASYTVAETLAGMSDSAAPEGYSYILDASLPAGVVVLCLLFELVFIFLLAWSFLWKMKRLSPLELLHKGADHVVGIRTPGIFAGKSAHAEKISDIADTAPVPAGIDMEKLCSQAFLPTHRSYHALHHGMAYILRHMLRGPGKTAVSLILTIVLSAGIGTFTMARLTYRDAVREAEVKGRAVEFTSDSVSKLEDSKLLQDIYYYNCLDVRVNGIGTRSGITFTNNLERYLTEDYHITYAEGYDASVFKGTGGVCLVEKKLAEKLGVQAGDEITLMSDMLYQFMPQVYTADKLEMAIERAGKPYKVVGILETADEKGTGIFTSINDAAQTLYGQVFPVGYCEFTLADNKNVKEVTGLLEDLRKAGMRYSNNANFHIDSEVLKNATRIRELLESLFPIAVAAAVLIGLFGPWLLIMQLAEEAAFLRILGVTKRRTRCILVFEQIILCIVGIALVAGILAIFSPGLFMRSIKTISLCWMLYFLGNFCGAFAAAIEVTRHRVLELLQVRE